MSITYLEAIREAQARALAEDPRVFIYGQDVGPFGGAFKATKNLAHEFPGRVLDAPISEDAMVGAAVGAAIEGMRPIIEMQFADFSTTGFNQIVNNAAALFWRTNVPCPITIRLPCGGTSGGGPYHSQSMEALYAHYPGLVVMTPATVEVVRCGMGSDPRSRWIAVAPGFACKRRFTASSTNILDADPSPRTLLLSTRIFAITVSLGLMNTKVAFPISIQ